MKKVAWSLLVVVLLVAAILVVWRGVGASKKHAGQRGGADLTLDVAKVSLATLPLNLQAVGQAISEHSVAVRPQISGQLIKVDFTEGAAVRKGQLLFEIAPAPYEAAVLSAKAAWESASANFKRMQNLLPKHYVTDQDYQNAKAAADQALASYQTAQINLGYTRITAPIAGRTGLLSVKSGNLVSTSDAAPLVTINQMQPIAVQFSLPQQDLDQVRQYRQRQSSLPVAALDESGARSLATGELVFLDNQVDATTGTFTLKASFANGNEALWPGQFVTVQVQLDQQKVLAMPASALQTGQDGNFVYQVKNGKTVITKIVVLREQGTQAVVSAGLVAGDEVVARVPRNLRAGMPAQTQLLSDAGAVQAVAPDEQGANVGTNPEGGAGATP